MKLVDYLKDKIILIIIYFIIFIFILFLLIAFNIQFLLTSYIMFLLFILGLILLLYDYFTKRSFYNRINKSLDNLDKKYLITEVIDNCNFLEGNMLLNYLYDINKNMIEDINKYKNNNVDFKEYIELWCHEIKTPVATTKMIIENNKNSVTNSINEEINKIENFIEQVLYYARSESVEKDYIVKDININKIVNNVIKKNKKLLISKKIKIKLENLDINVKSDSKWLEFIINQIINNSIKYSKENPVIKISAEKNKNNIVFNILDNGIGIKESEIDKVFDKSFTGSNGRNKYNSTGIGLYLCKKLCDRLDHKILIESKLNDYTKVSIIFPISSMIELNK